MTRVLVALAVVVVIAAWIGRVTEGRRSLDAADGAMRRGDYVEAIVFARAAAEARCPWCSVPERAYEKLIAIAAAAEAKADVATALAAWRAIRGTALGTSIFDRMPPPRGRADVEIARLEHRIDVAGAAAGAAPSPAATEDRLRAALDSTTVPAGSVFALLAVGAVLFGVGARRLARAFQKTDVALTIAGIVVAIVGVVMF